jgi:N,N'-diacetyllegionaminate synthase
MAETFIIAEVGSNYGGRYVLAERFVTRAAEIKANAVKFQSYLLSKLLAPKVKTVDGLVDNPALKIFPGDGLPEEWHETLKQTADKAGIEFMTTPFYLEMVPLLEEIGVKTYKIASGDITFLPLLKAIGETKKNVILSTGASSLAEVDKALNILKQAGAANISLLHCVSIYPPKWDEINLKAMVTLKEHFGLNVGISDHSPGMLIPIAAVALGATVIEKHVTFHRELPGPDHPFAMTFEEFGEMVEQVRLLEKALGSGTKEPSAEELARRYRFRRGVYNPETLEPAKGTEGIWLRPEYS